LSFSNPLSVGFLPSDRLDDVIVAKNVIMILDNSTHKADVQPKRSASAGNSIGMHQNLVECDDSRVPASSTGRANATPVRPRKIVQVSYRMLVQSFLSALESKAVTITNDNFMELPDLSNFHDLKDPVTMEGSGVQMGRSSLEE
jgi:hypothetical protein